MTDSLDEERKRSRQTVALLVGGAVSLALPLLGVAFMKYRDSREPVAKTGMAFERRDTPMVQPLPVAAAAASLPPASQKNSLGFIQAGEGMRDANAPVDEKPRTALQQAAAQAGMGNDGVGMPGAAGPQQQQAPQANQPPPQSAPAPAQQTQTAARAGKTKVPFSPPRLHTDKSFGTQFGGQKPQPSGGFKQMPGGGGMGGQQGMGGMPGGMPQGMPGGMPPGMPGGMPPGGMPAGAPDMSQMMRQAQGVGQTVNQAAGQVPPQYQQMIQQATQQKR